MENSIEDIIRRATICSDEIERKMRDVPRNQPGPKFWISKWMVSRNSPEISVCVQEISPYVSLNWDEAASVPLICGRLIAAFQLNIDKLRQIKDQGIKKVDSPPPATDGTDLDGNLPSDPDWAGRIPEEEELR